MLWRKRLARGFTLVEMMVVVVIILVLASLMFVGFSHAQRTADAVHCMNNLDKIGKVILNYAVLYGGGALPDFSITGGRVREQWVFALDFIDEEDRFLSQQGTDKLLPPRMAPPILQCRVDVQLFVNSQSLLTSYWMHPANTYRMLASVTNADETLLGFEGDAYYETGMCGCRFHRTDPPVELDVTHSGGAHVLFVNGTGQLYTTQEERALHYWERKAGFR